jgi:hypothetical protein
MQFFLSLRIESVTLSMVRDEKRKERAAKFMQTLRMKTIID